jgi:hypothetical protein
LKLHQALDIIFGQIGKEKQDIAVWVQDAERAQAYNAGEC